MNSSSIAFSSREFLRMIESLGLTGNWGWSFTTHEQVWSPGLYNVLALEAGTVRPDYDLLLSLVHPDDRPALEGSAEIVRTGFLSDRTFRIIRHDGTMRLLMSRGEVFHTPGGEPIGAAGVVIDVTDRERIGLAYADAARRQGPQAENGIPAGNGAAAPGCQPASLTDPDPESAAEAESFSPEEAIDRRHLRAARALLDWSMADLAQASGLSFSTVRRLEESAEGGTVRSRRAAVAALRAAGIDFTRAAGDAVAIAKVG
ncbi:PAS domain-containing protein [Methylobacterium soli]|uniref:histidine kinase n=2 Tax=Methylobacterium soli TaxID=553447 RepID=A0A6L3SUJ8_9HYPH|nr:PAS domain-containing protein [Methylobacterium soli]